MVHVVEQSLYGQGYREINQQLAKDNGELRQQLSQAFHEIAQQRIQIHRRDVAIVQLKRQIKELSAVQIRYKAIKEIVVQADASMDQGADSSNGEDGEAIEEEVTQLEAMEEVQTEPEDENVNGTDNEKENEGQEAEVEEEEEEESTMEAEGSALALEPISEAGEEDDQDGYATKTLLSPAPSANDSLMPAEVTSVPPINLVEKTMQTPSIWNCLDTLETPASPDDNNQQEQQQQRRQQQQQISQHQQELLISQSSIKSSSSLRMPSHSQSPILPRPRKSNDIFHSTPVQPLRVANRKAEAIIANQHEASYRQPHNQQQQQQQQQPPQTSSEPTRYNLRKRAKR